MLHPVTKAFHKETSYFLTYRNKYKGDICLVITMDSMLIKCICPVKEGTLM